MAPGAARFVHAAIIKKVADKVKKSLWKEAGLKEEDYKEHVKAWEAAGGGN